MNAHSGGRQLDARLRKMHVIPMFRGRLALLLSLLPACAHVSREAVRDGAGGDVRFAVGGDGGDLQLHLGPDVSTVALGAVGPSGARSTGASPIVSLAASPDGALLYALDAAGRVSRVDLHTRAVAPLAVPGAAAWQAPAPGPQPLLDPEDPYAAAQPDDAWLGLHTVGDRLLAGRCAWRYPSEGPPSPCAVAVWWQLAPALAPADPPGVHEAPASPRPAGTGADRPDGARLTLEPLPDGPLDPASALRAARCDLGPATRLPRGTLLPPDASGELASLPGWRGTEKALWVSRDHPRAFLEGLFSRHDGLSSAWIHVEDCDLRTARSVVAIREGPGASWAWQDDAGTWHLERGAGPRTPVGGTPEAPFLFLPSSRPFARP
jgi:hypothetical protein